MLCYIQDTIKLTLTLGTDRSRAVKCWINKSFATRHKMRSQTGGTMTMRRGIADSMARKQKLNTTSSTEAELEGANEVMPQMLWTHQFLLSQGVKEANNILYQGTQSATLFEKNGMTSSSTQTRHINITNY
jgi:hypothetical protein